MQDVETSDIVLAAYLKLQGFALNSITKTATANRGVFHFANVPTEVLTTFDLGSAQVEPLAFNNAIKSLTTAVRRIDLRS